MTFLLSKKYNIDSYQYNYPFVVRLTSDYTLDQNFGNGGTFVPDGLAFQNYGISGADFCKLDDGSLIVVADYSKIIKITPSGSLDMTFGDAGVMNFAGKTFKHIIPLADGKFLLSGNMTRLNADFSLDTSFSPIGAYTYFTDAKQQNDGKIVTIYNTLSNGFIQHNTAHVSRYDSNGTMELTQAITLNDEPYNTINGIEFDADGKILLFGGHGYSVAQGGIDIFTPYLLRVLPELAPLSTDALVDSRTLMVYPNPFADRIRINLSNVSVTHVKLFDLQGRLVKDFDESGWNIVDDGIEIASWNLEKGTYLLRVYDTAGTVHDRKMIKQ